MEKIRKFATDEEIPEKCWYLTTILDGQFKVWHYFIVEEKS